MKTLAAILTILAVAVVLFVYGDGATLIDNSATRPWVTGQITTAVSVATDGCVQVTGDIMTGALIMTNTGIRIWNGSGSTLATNVIGTDIEIFGDDVRYPGIHLACDSVNFAFGQPFNDLRMYLTFDGSYEYATWLHNRYAIGGASLYSRFSSERLAWYHNASLDETNRIIYGDDDEFTVYHPLWALGGSGNVLTNGGTVHTIVSNLTNSNVGATIYVTEPTATNSPVTKHYVDEKVSDNFVSFLSTNLVLGYTNSITPTNLTFSSSPTLGSTSVKTSFVASAVDQYGVAFLATNRTITQLNGNVAMVELWMNENSPGTVTVKPELYLYDTVLSNLVEFGETVASQTVASGSTSIKHVFSVPYPSFATNNACYLAMRIKVTSLLLTPTVFVGCGGTTPSYISVAVPSESFVASDSLKLGGQLPAYYVPTNTWQAYTGQLSRVCISDPVETVSGARSNVQWLVLDTPKAIVVTGAQTHARVGVTTQQWVWGYSTNLNWDGTNGVVGTFPVSNVWYSIGVSSVTIPAHSRIGTLWSEAVNSVTQGIGQLLGFEQ